MGNKLCKKKSDTVDCAKNSTKSTPFDRIITRLHLRPKSWKSESQLNQNKQVNRESKSKSINQMDSKQKNEIFSKSSDWTEVSLESVEDEPVHLRNPKLSLIFSTGEGTPIPPPRKHSKSIREKIEQVAKNGLQALQPKKPVEEPLCIKKTINYDCPCGKIHPAGFHHSNKNNVLDKTNERNIKPNDFNLPPHGTKRKKTLSVVSLPNYNDLKFSVANIDNTDKQSVKSGSEHASIISLPNEAKSNKSKNFMPRCRSFGSLLPQQLIGKLKPVPKKIADIESDDSFGPLEDWDLGLIEHYNPRDASLPRPRKILKTKEKLVSDIESLVEKDDKTDLSVANSTPPQFLTNNFINNSSDSPSIKTVIANNNEMETPKPLNNISDINKTHEKFNFDNTEEIIPQYDTKNDHSSLMKILEEYSVREKQLSLADETFPDIEDPLISDSSSDISENTKHNKNTNDNFIKAEKVNFIEKRNNSSIKI